MDIHQFEGFVAAAAHGSYTRASEELCVTRQALSKSVKRLEGEVGFKVFTVGENCLELTDQGRMLLNDVMPLVSAFNDVEARYSPRGELVEDVRVAMSHGALDPVAGNPVLALASDPSVRLLVDESHADGVLAMVRSGEADVGFVCTCPDYVGEFEAVALAHPGYFVRIPRGHDLAGRSFLELRDVDGRGFVTLGRHDHAHRRLLEECGRAGVAPHVVAELPDAGLVRELCDREGALSFASSPDERRDAGGAVRVPLLMSGAQKFGTYAIRRKNAALTRASRQLWHEVQARDADARRPARKR